MPIDRTWEGRRVRLIALRDEWSRLKPGKSLGTLRGTLDGGETILVNWDDGSRLSLLLDDGDAFEFVEDDSAD